MGSNPWAVWEEGWTLLEQGFSALHLQEPGKEGRNVCLGPTTCQELWGDPFLIFFSVKLFNRSLRKELLAVLERRKVKLREVKKRGQCHTARK